MKRWILVIGIHLLFFLSFFIDLQMLEGTLNGSRFLGFHMIDPFMTIQVYLATYHLPINMIIGTTTILIVYLLVGGRSYCAWVCPYGTLNDLVYKIRRKVSKISIKIPLELKLSFNILKYVVFAFVIIALLNGNPRYYVPIHTSDLVTSIKLAYLTGGDVYFARLYLILGALLLGVLIPRFWCRYLCPLGTTFQLIKKGFRRFKKCSKCGNYG